MTLSPRELSSKDLPSRIWVNERLTYTHGYGVVVSPVNRVYVEPLYIAAEKGQLPELKRVIVGVGERIAMGATLDDAIARVFGGPAPCAEVEAAVRAMVEPAASLQTVEDAAAALARATEELRRVNELLQRLRGARPRERPGGGATKKFNNAP